MAKEQLTITGEDDGSHIVTLPGPDGRPMSWKVPADVSLETIEAMLQEVMGPLLGKRTVTVEGTKH